MCVTSHDEWKKTKSAGRTCIRAECVQGNILGKRYDDITTHAVSMTWTCNYQHLYTFLLFSAREFLLSVTFSLSFGWNIIHACTGTHPANSERHSPSPLHHSYFQSDDGIFSVVCCVMNGSPELIISFWFNWITDGAPTQERKGCEMMMRHSHSSLERWVSENRIFDTRYQICQQERLSVRPEIRD